MLKEKFLKVLLELPNRRFISYLLRKFATSKMSKVLIPTYAKTYNIRLDEMEKDMKEYHSLHDFFTRRLKEGVRTVDIESDTVVSPVDCVVEDFGIINEDKQFTVKGKHYSIIDMLGKEERTHKYEGGQYFVLYLSPSHYHRIHSPIDGEVVERFELGTKSAPVNELGLKYGKSPLSKNYRVVSELVHNGQHVAVVKVGAMFVNTIHVTNESQAFMRGDEVGYFSFGSTIVLLFEKGSFEIDPAIHYKQDLFMGQKIGKLVSKLK
ncbi:phosphatidylserine decarboxylase [Priestia taiwanensis]|uniref:Phosphatidylserine decarboxylase proenzyme n=1 Tax=Priestia taiwanensis TaxID=1347902 RepID=A0A917ATS7_9BACI|nr:phosphatidylserine decarboxylase [Priestia taiwanensis]MBM7363702.1 phosphatidylserine decarboxylase [Priestia taiwanensis]GGE74818.1 phosphatidylserine decarboxylase proenzyme [Priestia taiwanensis]